MFKSIFSLTLLLLAFQSFAQGPLISAKDFAAELKANKNLVIIDVNAADVYAKQHIQGAINLPHKELYHAVTVAGQTKPTE